MKDTKTNAPWRALLRIMYGSCGHQGVPRCAAYKCIRLMRNIVSGNRLRQSSTLFEVSNLNNRQVLDSFEMF